MQRTRALHRIGHMLDHAREAASLAAGRRRIDLDSDRMLSLALTRLMEIIGEAAAQIPMELRTANPAIPWPEIISLRNRLIHGYDAVDHDILWQIISTDLPPLIRELEKLAANQAG